MIPFPVRPGFSLGLFAALLTKSGVKLKKVEFFALIFMP